MRAPRVTFSGKVSPHRRFVFGSMPLADVKRVKNHFGVTVNDVVVASAPGAIREWLIAHDELPDESAPRADPGVGPHDVSRWAPTATGSA